MKAIILSLCLMTLNAYADHHDEMKGKTFQEKKAKALEGIEKRLAFINETKACVNSAMDDAGLKACREKAKAQRKMWKDSKKK